MEVKKGSRDFFKAAVHYVDVIAGAVYKGLDFENKKVVLERIYECTGCQNPRLLQAAYLRLERKLVD